jgi:large subunit ribosomal protein L28
MDCWELVREQEDEVSMQSKIEGPCAYIIPDTGRQSSINRSRRDTLTTPSASPDAVDPVAMTHPLLRTYIPFFSAASRRPHVLLPSLCCTQLFSTTSSRLNRKPNRSDRRLKAQHAFIPTYPHGPAKVFKRSDRGLFGGLRIKFGNIVNKSGLITTKARRSWKPNIQRKRLYSEALDKNLRLKVSTRVIRTIDKVGGLDNYLLGNKSARIKELGMLGWKLRWKVMQQPQTQERFRAQRRALGLPEEESAKKQEILDLLQEATSNIPKSGAERKAMHIKKWQARKRKDLWSNTVITDLLREESQRALEKGDVRSHKVALLKAEDLDKTMAWRNERVAKSRKAQKERRDRVRMLPRPGRRTLEATTS